MKVIKSPKRCATSRARTLKRKPSSAARKCVGVAQSEFELRSVVFGVDRFQGDLGGVARLPNRVEQTKRVDGGTRAVDVGPWRVERLPATLSVGREEEGLELHADVGTETQRLPIGDRSAQSATRRYLDGTVVVG